LTDQELLDRLRAGSREAFDVIFRAHYARLTSVATGMLRDSAVAEELAQDVMVELWRRRDTISIDITIQAYLVRAVRNRVLNHIRHERVAERAEPLLIVDHATPKPTDRRASQSEIDAALHAALDKLPARCREVFELSRVHGLKYLEIASAMDISIKTVEAQMGKALRILREEMAAFLPTD
jgi:RNA polymerase sigma-70 factor, ECF subfamily